MVLINSAYRFLSLLKAFLITFTKRLAEGRYKLITNLPVIAF